MFENYFGISHHLKRKNLTREKSIEIYVIKKKKYILSTLSNTLDEKLKNVYDVSIKTNKSTTERNGLLEPNGNSF